MLTILSFKEYTKTDDPKMPAGFVRYWKNVRFKDEHNRTAYRNIFKDPSIVETFYNKIEKGKTCGGKIIEHQSKFLVVFPDEREEDVIRKHTYLFIKKSKHMEKIDLNGIWKTDSNNTFKFKGNEFEYSAGGKVYNGTFETSEDEIKNERTIKFSDHIKDINIWIKQDDENIIIVENSGNKIQLKKISN